MRRGRLLQEVCELDEVGAIGGMPDTCSELVPVAGSDALFGEDRVRGVEEPGCPGQERVDGISGRVEHRG